MANSTRRGVIQRRSAALAAVVAAVVLVGLTLGGFGASAAGEQPAVGAQPTGRTVAVPTVDQAVAAPSADQSADAASADQVVEARSGGHAVVEPGDTLWELAARHAPPGSDPRAYLHRLRELNGLDGGDVRAWTVVRLPAV